MKKLTRIMCLTLAMLMLMGLSVFATQADYKAVPVTEDFSSLDNSGTSAYNFFRASYSGKNYNKGVRGWSYSDAKSGVSGKLTATGAVGLAGKAIDDKVLYTIPSATTYAGTVLQLYVQLAETTTNGAASFPADAVEYSNYTFEFDYLSMGSHDKITMEHYQLNDAKTGYDASGVPMVVVQNGATGPSFKADGVALNQTFEKGKWYHIAVYVHNQAGSSDYKDYEMYINGEYVATASYKSQRSLSRMRLTFTPGDVSNATDKDLNNYRMALDNLKISSGNVTSSYVHPEATVAVGSIAEIDTATNTISVPYGTTVGDIKEAITLANGGTIRAYENNATTLQILNYGNSPADNILTDDIVLTNNNVIITENAVANGYEYYSVVIADGFLAKQAGSVKNNIFTSLTNDIDIIYSETPAEADSRILIAGVYEADGTLVDVFMSGEEATTLTPSVRNTLSLTVEASALSGLTAGAKVKVFAWNDLENIQPADVENQNILLTCE